MPVTSRTYETPRVLGPYKCEHARYRLTSENARILGPYKCEHARTKLLTLFSSLSPSMTTAAPSSRAPSSCDGADGGREPPTPLPPTPPTPPPLECRPPPPSPPRAAPGVSAATAEPATADPAAPAPDARPLWEVGLDKDMIRQQRPLAERAAVIEAVRQDEKLVKLHHFLTLHGRQADEVNRLRAQLAHNGDREQLYEARCSRNYWWSQVQRLFKECGFDKTAGARAKRPLAPQIRSATVSWQHAAAAPGWGAPPRPTRRRGAQPPTPTLLADGRLRLPPRVNHRRHSWCIVGRQQPQRQEWQERQQLRGGGGG